MMVALIAKAAMVQARPGQGCSSADHQRCENGMPSSCLPYPKRIGRRRVCEEEGEESEGKKKAVDTGLLR